jgi:hypothetical protein
MRRVETERTRPLAGKASNIPQVAGEDSVE